MFSELFANKNLMRIESCVEKTEIVMLQKLHFMTLFLLTFCQLQGVCSLVFVHKE